MIKAIEQANKACFQIQQEYEKKKADKSKFDYMLHAEINKLKAEEKANKLGGTHGI